MSVTPSYCASCKCGKVEFTLSGKHILAPNCCCNDCVTAAYFVDAKAKAAGVENTSAFVSGNNQAATMVMWPSSGIQLVKGKEYIKYFKLRSKSPACRCYADCCKTTVIGLAGTGFPIPNVGIPFNRSTLSPEYPASYYSLTSEIQRKDEFPTSSIKMSSSLPLGAVCKLAGALMFGGGKSKDDNFRSLFTSQPPDDEIEIAGEPAYRAAGFDTSKIKF